MQIGKSKDFWWAEPPPPPPPEGTSLLQKREINVFCDYQLTSRPLGDVQWQVTLWRLNVQLRVLDSVTHTYCITSHWHIFKTSVVNEYEWNKINIFLLFPLNMWSPQFVRYSSIAWCDKYQRTGTPRTVCGCRVGVRGRSRVGKKSLHTTVRSSRLLVPKVTTNV